MLEKYRKSNLTPAEAEMLDITPEQLEAHNREADEAQARFWHAAYMIPAAHVNTYLFTRHDTVMRLSFLEQSAPFENLQPRATVTMSLGTLMELHQTLGLFIEGVKRDFGLAEEPNGSNR